MALSTDEQKLYDMLDQRRRQPAADEDIEARIRRIVQEQMRVSGPLGNLATQLTATAPATVASPVSPPTPPLIPAQFEAPVR